MPKVIRRFRDINHNDHTYEEGDTYPAEGFEADAGRVSFLSKPHPKYGVAFLSIESEEEKITSENVSPVDSERLNDANNVKPSETEKVTKKTNSKKKTSTKK